MTTKMKTMDGNNAAALSAYAFTEVAAIYPITPSSPMAEVIDEWSANGKKNIFGGQVDVVEMQAEGGAAGALHGSLSAGALTTTFTASQGLLLMVPNMYKIAGEMLPAVFHVTARALAGHALSIFGDHSDVMATRQTGFAMLASNSVQETMDLACVAHLSAIKASLPFEHFFDGFRTSHEIQKVELIDYDEVKKLVDYDALSSFKQKSMNPNHPFTKGTAQNPDIFFQAKEASNRFYDELPDIVADYMNKLGEITGRTYKPFEYYGSETAERIIIAMGSVCETIEETIDYLNAKGENIGLLKVHLYRPFSAKYFFDVLPKSVKKIAVLDRTKEPGALGEPLYLDVRSLFYGKENAPIIVGGRYGLGSKDTTPSHVKSVYDNLALDAPKDGFTVGITDDVTHLSLPVSEYVTSIPKETISCKFWGLGSDGTVGANKSAIKIIGDSTDMYAQGYFDYDSKKSGGVTMSHLRFGKAPIKATYLIDKADFVSCSMQSYLTRYDVVGDCKAGGTFLLNTTWSGDELEANIPASMKKYIADNNISFYTIDANKIAGEIGLGRKINMIMQSAFFKLANIIPYEDAEKQLKDAVVHSYGKKGENIVKMNYAAIDNGVNYLVKIDVPEAWKTAVGVAPAAPAGEPEFISKVLRPMSAQQGNALPVSTFTGIEDGRFPAGTSQYEKRTIALSVPSWEAESCSQCGQCSFVCPHAAIRTVLLSEEEYKNAPAAFGAIPAATKALAGYYYKVQVSPHDCTGCASCIGSCPTNSIKMVDIEEVLDTESANWDYAVSLPQKELKNNRFSVKGSQFVKPMLEFSGACEGCGETPYAKLVTQLFGERMYIANATGCSSIWGASAPSTPYTVNDKGQGPVWANSLFEDNAEYGYGMYLSVKKQRNMLKANVEALLEKTSDTAVKEACSEWLADMNDTDASIIASEKLVSALEAVSCGCEERAYILNNKDHLTKKSMWIFGGDGWAYDIGYGGLDHVLASGENINVLVFDTEVYSNTGGQSSKSTPTAAVAKFAAQGKKTKKKDLGMMAAAYGYVYVAQVAMGADHSQLIKALKEAEAYNGPSLIIAYAPCINHGIKKGMSTAMQQMDAAVKCGYWHLYRFNPTLKEAGKNPFTLDSKEPTESFRAFLNTESRYTALSITFPNIAEELFAKTEADSRERYAKYKEMAEKQN